MSERDKYYPQYRQALQALEIQAINFAYRFVNEQSVRAEYLRRTQTMSRELRAAVDQGISRPREAAEIAQQMRNEIMDMARKRSSELGRAYATSKKKVPPTLDDLIQKYSKEKFKRSFDQLSKSQKNKVFAEIVESAGRPNAGQTAIARRLGAAGRALWVLSAAIAIYNIGTAEDKADAAGREVATMGGGFAGGAAGGALAGVWFGPVGVAVGVAVGGALGAIMSDRAYVQIRGQSGATVNSIIRRYTSMFGTDETGIANALYNEVGIDMRTVSAVFAALSRDYNGDADDVARIYVSRVQTKRGAVLHSLRLDHNLKRQLIDIFHAGWTTKQETRQIQFLKSL